MANLPSIPTDSELEILQILWQNGPKSVRYINDELNSKREVGYTTTLKIMQIMHEKGLVSRNTDERSHVYTPLAHEQNIKHSLLNTFIDSTFNGSMKDMVLQALGGAETTRDEIEEIKVLLDQLQHTKP